MITPLSWIIEVERNTITHQCAIDSGMIYIPRVNDRDILLYRTEDKMIWVEFTKFRDANNRAITKEHNKRYQY